MAKKQTRRSVSVTGATYEAIRLDCEARGLSLSEYIEGLIYGDRQARGLPVMPRPERAREIGRAIAAGKRAGRRQVERAVAAVRAIPSESKIVAGPPPEQTAFLGRVETPPGPLRAVQVNAPSRWHTQAHAHAQAAIARREAPLKPVAIRSGFEPNVGQPIARPTHGDKLPPPDPSRSARNVVLL